MFKSVKPNYTFRREFQRWMLQIWQITRQHARILKQYSNARHTKGHLSLSSDLHPVEKRAHQECVPRGRVRVSGMRFIRLAPLGLFTLLRLHVVRRARCLRLPRASAAVPGGTLTKSLFSIRGFVCSPWRRDLIVDMSDLFGLFFLGAGSPFLRPVSYCRSH